MDQASEKLEHTSVSPTPPIPPTRPWTFITGVVVLFLLVAGGVFAYWHISPKSPESGIVFEAKNILTEEVETYFNVGPADRNDTYVIDFGDGHISALSDWTELCFESRCHLELSYTYKEPGAYTATLMKLPSDCMSVRSTEGCDAVTTRYTATTTIPGSTLDVSTWHTYTNTDYGFTFKYPPNAQIGINRSYGGGVPLWPIVQFSIDFEDYTEGSPGHLIMTLRVAPSDDPKGLSWGKYDECYVRSNGYDFELERYFETFLKDKKIESECSGEPYTLTGRKGEVLKMVASTFEFLPPDSSLSN